MKIFCAWLTAVVFLGELLAASGRAATPVELLSLAEAAQPNLPAGKNGSPVTGVQSLTESESKTTPVPGAPQIIVETPSQGIQVSAPFPVKIRFVPAAGAKINLDSVKVEVLKLVTISLLSRVKPYLTPAGINVPEAKIPAGSYNVRIAVADDQGREGSTVQVWTVH